VSLALGLVCPALLGARKWVVGVEGEAGSVTVAAVKGGVADLKPWNELGFWVGRERGLLARRSSWRWEWERANGRVLLWGVGFCYGDQGRRHTH
jgi:hypothetical protein